MSRNDKGDLAGQLEPPASSASTAATRLDAVIRGILTHGLFIVLVILLAFVALPFVAPLAFAAGHAHIGTIIQLLYSPFCHQLPQRSWFFFGPQLTYTFAEITKAAGTTDPLHLRHFYGSPELGWKVAWSDRMVSFYFMTPIFGFVYLLLRRFENRTLAISTKLLLLSLLPLVIDGSTHLLNDAIWGISAGGWRDTNVWLLLLTQNRFPHFYSGDQYGTFNWWMRLLTGIVAAWGMAFYIFPRLDAVLRR